MTSEQQEQQQQQQWQINTAVVTAASCCTVSQLTAPTNPVATHVEEQSGESTAILPPILAPSSRRPLRRSCASIASWVSPDYDADDDDDDEHDNEEEEDMMMMIDPAEEEHMKMPRRSSFLETSREFMQSVDSLFE